MQEVEPAGAVSSPPHGEHTDAPTSEYVLAAQEEHVPPLLKLPAAQLPDPPPPPPEDPPEEVHAVEPEDAARPLPHGVHTEPADDE